MGGEEALARTALVITFDARQLFDETTGKLKNPNDWPDEAGQLIESFDVGGKVRLASRMAALRIVLEQTGKLKTIAGGIDELAAAIKADLEAHGSHGTEGATE